jgi:metal-sulfur cluster biosynthetic enzyme
MNSSSPKDNANPIILDIHQQRKTLYGNWDDEHQPLYWDELLRSFRINNSHHHHHDSSPYSMMTMEDYSSLRSLQQSAMESSSHDCISLFKKLHIWNHHDDSSSSRRSSNDNNDHSPSVVLDHVMLFHEQKRQHDIAVEKEKKKNKKKQMLEREDDESVATTTTTSMVMDIDHHDNNNTTLKRQSLSYDPVTADEIFELIRTIQDPEHPLTLEQLGVVIRSQIIIEEKKRAKEGNQQHPTKTTTTTTTTCLIRFTPTVPHCSMATLIGLCIRVKLLRSFPRHYKTIVMIEPGTHSTEHAINQQLADKERVCAALENQHLLGVVNKCIQANDCTL